MSELSRRLNEEFEKLKTRRDEMRVQIDLGKKDAEDAWQELDERWAEAETKLRQLGRTSKESAESIGEAAGEVMGDAKDGIVLTATEVGEAAEKLIDELREGFDRLRKML